MGEPGKLSLKEFFGKVSSYAYGDIKSKIFWHPSKGLMSHNIKIILVFARYILFLFLSVQFLRFTRFYFWVPFLFLLYLLWPIYKWRDVLKTKKERLYLPLVQIVSDFAVIIGLLKGIFER